MKYLKAIPVVLVLLMSQSVLATDEVVKQFDMVERDTINLRCTAPTTYITGEVIPQGVVFDYQLYQNGEQIGTQQGLNGGCLFLPTLLFGITQYGVTVSVDGGMASEISHIVEVEGYYSGPKQPAPPTGVSAD